VQRANVEAARAASIPHYQTNPKAQLAKFIQAAGENRDNTTIKLLSLSGKRKRKLVPHVASEVSKIKQAGRNVAKQPAGVVGTSNLSAAVFANKKNRQRPARTRSRKGGNQSNNNGSKVTTTRAPVSIGYNSTLNRPVAKSHRIKRRELIKDITGTAAFGINEFVVNPGLNQSFPWLSNIARGYEMYKVHSLSFEVLPSVSTSEAGKVMMSVDWDVKDDAPTNKRDMLNMQTNVSSPPWTATVLHCSPAMLNRRGNLFVRAGAPKAGEDVKLSDLCKLYVATQGTSTNELGELHVTIDVEFFNPQPLKPLGCYVLSTPSNTDGTNQFGTDGADTVITGTAPVTVSGNTVTIPAGFGERISVAMLQIGTAITANAMTTSTTNCSVYNSISIRAPNAAAINGGGALALAVTDSTLPATFTIIDGATTITEVRMLISPTDW
jgi:hypothetical protein